MVHESEALSAIRRSSQIYYGQLAEQVALSCGVALVCPQYPEHYDGNHLRELTVPAGRSLEGIYEEVQGFYAGRDLKCYRWVPAAGQPTDAIEAFLTARGFTPIWNLAMKWTREVAIPSNPRVRILPARAMRKTLREIILGKKHFTPEIRARRAELALDRLDDPNYDMFVALLNDQPAGHGSLIQVGEIGRLENIYVAEAHRRQGVAMALVAHLLALSKRLAMRITVLETEETNTRAQALYAKCGFERGGRFVEYMSPDARGLFHLSIEQ